MSDEPLEELGSIDYVVLEWPGEQPTAGEVQPLMLDLVDRGIIRILDIAFMAKDRDGSVSGVELGDLKEVAAAFAEFEGASSGLLGFDDLQEAATALEPGTSAAVIVWENRWAAPVAAALRRSGGQLVAYPYDQPAPAYQEPPPEYAATPQPAPQQDPVQQLKDLAELKDQGILTEEEFAAQKARILSG